METLRLFLAAEIDPPVLDRLVETQAALKGEYPNLRWLGREGMHLTFKFLGNVFENQVETIAGIVAPLVSGIPATPIALTQVAAFPGWRRVNVVVAECTAPPALEVLYKRLQGAFVDLNIPAEQRPFRPHITLARPRDRRNSRMPPCELRFSGVAWTVDKLVLFQSKLGAKGARYEALRVFPLR